MTPLCPRHMLCILVGIEIVLLGAKITRTVLMIGLVHHRSLSNRFHLIRLFRRRRRRYPWHLPPCRPRSRLSFNTHPIRRRKRTSPKKTVRRRRMARSTRSITRSTDVTVRRARNVTEAKTKRRRPSSIRPPLSSKFNPNVYFCFDVLLEKAKEFFRLLICFLFCLFLRMADSLRCMS